MRTVQLGKSNLEVAKVGFGGIPITRPSDNDARKTIQRAIELGVNFFDTATGYGLGESEKRFGKAVADCRDKVYIASKTAALSAEGSLKAVNRSLKQLNMDYIDLYQTGNITTWKKYERIMESNGALNGLRQAMDDGLIRHIGLSTHNVEIAKAATLSGDFETVLVVFNLLAQEVADELLDLAKENDVGVIAMKPFGAGLIKDARLAINYLLQYDNVVILPGIETIKDIEEVVSIANTHSPISSKLQSKIDSFHEQHSSRFCRHCELCQPCPNDVNITSMIYLGAAWNLRSFDWFMKGAEKTVESWQECADCGECESKCPFGLPIRDIMKENSQLFQQAKMENK